MEGSTSQAESFYNREYNDERYACAGKAEEHPRHSKLKGFLDRYDLHAARCLEIGCGRGAFQDLVADYTGVDVTDSVRPFLHKPFFRCSAKELPFADNSFDAAWSVWVLEHVPEPELALAEMRRVLKPGGLLFLAPAWECRTWAAEGYAVRPFRDFSLTGKLIKASIPLRDSWLWRACRVYPRRLARLVDWRLRPRPRPFRYRILEPNYDHYWTADSDAINSMDPFDAILWFRRRGDECLSRRGTLGQFLGGGGPLVIRIGNKA